MLILQDIHYTHPNKDVLFQHLNLSISRHQKIALAGNNGTGKSTLLAIAAGILQPAHGKVSFDTKPYHVPQHFGQFDELTIAGALHVEARLNALKAILAGDVTEQHLAVLNDDWTLEECCEAALSHWKLDGLELTRPLKTLSGGQKTKVFLAGIHIHQPEMILMDEPSNHLDASSRAILYEYIQTTPSTLLVVSHDRKLLNLLDTVYELDKGKITVYGGNYDFYAEQKAIENEALNHDIKSKEKELKKARQTERETIERQQKLNARGKQKQEKSGIPRIMMNTLRNNAEKSTAYIKEVHAGKVNGIAQELNELRKALPGFDKMKIGFDDSIVHKGKILVKAENINYRYAGQPLWKQPVSFTITNGERLAVSGDNGSGKTTLIKLISGDLQPSEGSMQLAHRHTVYIDQDYSLVNGTQTVYELVSRLNTAVLQEHELKVRLARFLFTREDWNKPCSVLSGGERMRLTLCCLTIRHQAPDIIVLDEPTNNLDLQNIGILIDAISGYSGTLIAVSHDDYFLEKVRIAHILKL